MKNRKSGKSSVGLGKSASFLINRPGPGQQDPAKVERKLHKDRIVALYADKAARCTDYSGNGAVYATTGAAADCAAHLARKGFPLHRVFRCVVADHAHIEQL